MAGADPAAAAPLLRTRTVVFAAALVPAVMLANDYLAGAFARPWKAILQESGDWSMRFLVCGVCLAPLVSLTGQLALHRLRRMIGLFGAFYAALHLFGWCRQYGYDWPFLADEIVLRPYLMVGAIAALLLALLAATSPAVLHRALGPLRWRWLHLLMYPMVLAAFLHYLMSSGLHRPEVLIDGLLLVLGLVGRLWRGQLWRGRAAG